MPCRWFNLYGTDPAERTGRTRGRKEGSQYLGRVLVAFSIYSSERPQLANIAANPVRPPKSRTYQLWVDLYDLIDCDVIPSDSPIWAVISIGRSKSDKAPAKAKKKGNTSFWRFKER